MGGGCDHPGQGGCRSSIPHHCSPTYRNSWVGRSPPQQALRQETDSCPCQHQLTPTTIAMQRSGALPLCASEWMEWCARYVQMLSWWEELTSICGHANYKEFSQKVHASFEVAMACNWSKKVENYHVQPLAHPSIRKDHFLLPKNVRFCTQDICLTQLQHIIAYERALQHWAEEVHPPSPWPTSMPCKECTGAPMGNGAPHHFHRRCLHGHSTISMDRNNLTMVDKGCPPRVPKELHMKQQGQPKGIPVCNPQ